jgi:hypothetical protein
MKYFLLSIILILIIIIVTILYLPDNWFEYSSLENFQLENNKNDTNIITENENVQKPPELEEFEVVNNIFTDNNGFNIKYVPAKIENIKDGRYSVFTPNQIEEENNKCNWCRVVRRKGDNTNESAFITCSIKNMFMNYPYWFRSESQDKGFQLGRHAYMRDANNSGLDSYCRIIYDRNNIKPVGQSLDWKVICNPTKGLKISNTQYIDPEPPRIIEKYLQYYKNCIIWIPLNNEKPIELIRDYFIHNIGVTIENDKVEDRLYNYDWRNTENKKSINPTRIGKYLSMSTRMPMHHVRSVCMWVKYSTIWREELGENLASFPRWSRIIDFFHSPFKGHFTIGNIDTTGDIFFEIWHDEARVMRVEYKDFFKLDEWVHICFTTEDPLSPRPRWQLYRDGLKIKTFDEGHIPWDGIINAQWIGRSGDSEDEYFNGEIRDIRLYDDKLEKDKIKMIMEYYRPKMLFNE